MAGDGDKFFNISGGWQWKNTVNAVVGLEFEGKYHNAYELYIDLATAYDKCPVCNKVCSDSFWSYKTINCFSPFYEFFLIIFCPGNIFLAYTVDSHCPPFVVISSKP